MKKIKEAWTDMRNQPVIGIVTVIGTALAIFLIMIVTIRTEVKTMPIGPESNRDRLLHAKFICLQLKNGEGCSSGTLSEEGAHDLYFGLEGSEAATVYTGNNTTPVSADGGTSLRASLRETDADYWRVFRFTFLDGSPYSASSQRNSIVLSRALARKLFGTDKAVGRRVMLNRYEPYMVVGVVNDVPQLADRAYAEAWIPITSKHNKNQNTPGMGDFTTTILARSVADFPKIRADVKRREAQFNLKLEPYGYKLDLFGAPYTQNDAQYQQWSNMGPDTETPRRQRLIVYAILLLVPAVNLSTMTQSRLRHKVSEFGVRRAFGCTRRRLVADILTQNFLITLAGGILGLAFSMVFAWLFAGSLLIGEYIAGSATNITILSLLDWRILLAALGFCFVLNLLSSGIPAWRASRIHVVEAIGGIRK